MPNGWILKLNGTNAKNNSNNKWPGKNEKKEEDMHLIDSYFMYVSPNINLFISNMYFLLCTFLPRDFLLFLCIYSLYTFLSFKPHNILKMWIAAHVQLRLRDMNSINIGLSIFFSNFSTKTL